MPRNDNKTRPTKTSPEAYLRAVEPAERRDEGLALLSLFGKATGLEPALWGQSIIGYGRYRYESVSKRQGEYFLTGFSPRKSALSIYIMPGFEDFAFQLEALGPHKLGKSCLYLKKLSAIDPAVLEKIVRESVATMRSRYETWDA